MGPPCGFWIRSRNSFEERESDGGGGGGGGANRLSQSSQKSWAIATWRRVQRLHFIHSFLKRKVKNMSFLIHFFNKRKEKKSFSYSFL